MKASKQAIDQVRTCVDYGSEEIGSHITTFRGIKTGIIISLILCWLPFIVLSYLFGLAPLIGYVALLLAAFTVLGLISRHYGFLRSIIIHVKPSAEALES